MGQMQQAVGVSLKAEKILKEMGGDSDEKLVQIYSLLAMLMMQGQQFE
jgi:hypothetical protein